MHPGEIFGANVKRERERLKLTQEELGHSCGLNMTEVSRLEKARRDPRLGTIVKLARGLGVPPMQLLTGIP
ncbi:MAG TPA: helix-turn-helix transcriptional regulator [Solirubrobacteraceae bacterium]|nr:helix-turn-helix transcriptional regulator [Solirubrobacteraceae bacterium]